MRITWWPVRQPATIPHTSLDTIYAHALTNVFTYSDPNSTADSDTKAYSYTCTILAYRRNILRQRYSA
jgi:hypothetical protein